MFEINNVTYRNLQEQVLENKRQIAEHRQIQSVLADLDIRIQGKLETKTELDNVITTDLVYGDAYLVGIEEPYDLWVWTRANPSIGKNEAYWLYVGPISVEGPQGEPGASVKGAGLTDTGRLQLTLSNGEVITAQGPSLIGPQGVPGTNGITPEFTIQPTAGGTNLTIKTGNKVQTLFIQNGLNGAPGAQGPQGVPGTFDFKGVLSAAPDATLAQNSQPGDAYLVLVPDLNVYDIYVLITPTDDPANNYWQNMGRTSTGTSVLVGGNIVNEFNADTKLNKVSNTYQYPRAYTVNKAGQQDMTALVGDAPTQGTIALRGTNGVIKAATPQAYNDVTTKQYVDTLFSSLSLGGGSSGGGGGRFLGETLYFQEGNSAEINQHAEFGALARAKIFWLQLNGYTSGPFFRDSEYNSAYGKAIIYASGSFRVLSIIISGGSEGSSSYQISIQDAEDGGGIYDAYQWSDNKIIAFTDEQ